MRETALTEAAAARGGQAARGGPSICPSSSCAPAPSISSPCCKTQQTLFQAEDCAGAGAAGAAAGDRQPVSGARRRLAAEAGGNSRCTVNCRNRSGRSTKRAQSPRSGDRPRSSSLARRRVDSTSSTTRCRSRPTRSRFGAARRTGAGAGRTPRHRRRAGLSRRRRHHQGAQYRHRQPAGRRQADQRRLQGRPGRQERRRAGAHRSRPPTRRSSIRR